MVQLIGWLFKEGLRVEQESAQAKLGIASIEARATNKATRRSNAGALLGKIEPDAVCTRMALFSDALGPAHEWPVAGVLSDTADPETFPSGAFCIEH